MSKIIFLICIFAFFSCRTSESKLKIGVGEMSGVAIEHAHSDRITDLTFSEDGKYLYSGSKDGVLRSWDIVGGKVSLEKKAVSVKKPSIATCDQHGNCAVGGDLGDIELISLQNGRTKKNLNVYSRSFGHGLEDLQIVNLGSRLLVTTSSTVMHWDVDSNKMLFGGYATEGGLSNKVSRVSRDLSLAAYGNVNGPVNITRHRKFIGPIYPDGHELSLNFSPNGELLLTGSSDGNARLWDLTKLKKGLLRNSRRKKDDFAFIRTFSHKSEKEQGNQEIVHILSVAFSPDGKMVLTGSFDKSAKLWDISSGELLRTLIVDDSPINAVTFAPDSNSFALGTFNGSVKIYQQ